MARFPSISRVITGDVAWYLAGRLSDAERMGYALATNAVVLRGASGTRAAVRLRKADFAGSLWLDPAAYDLHQAPLAETLFGDYWQSVQQELQVEELISSGSYVGQGDIDGLESALDAEREWVANAGGRLSLALAASWLIRDLRALLDRLTKVDVPLALAFADRNDPLGRVGAVQGLVDLLRSVKNVAIMRSDLGALGAVSYGASLGAIGTSTTVRHVVPPGKTGGGRRDDKSPSVFVAELLDFKLGSHLDEFPVEASPICDLPCCRGKMLRRFNGEHSVAEARVHNRTSIGEVARRVMETPSELRPAAFTALCRSAEHAVAELSLSARRRLKVRPQVKAWARVR